MPTDTHAFKLTTPPSPEVLKAVAGLAEQDLFGQLLERKGRAAELGTEGDDTKLDWIDGIEKALNKPEWMAAVENEAAELLRLGIRRFIWAGMGGSVQTIYALRNLGLLDGAGISIYPLDSTDPATLNRIVRDIASLEGVDPAEGDGMKAILEATMMMGVSMGMTSEEPITHLEWFDGLLNQYEIADPSQHISVMTLPDSYLDQFARPRGCRMAPIQLDGENHTGGRFSAPATRVFLRPVALMVAAAQLAGEADASLDGALLRQVLQGIQELHGLDHLQDEEARKAAVKADPFVQLAAAIHLHGESGRNKVVLVVPDEWRGVEPWIEQLVEESLGKGGRGFMIFYADQAPVDQFQPDTIFVAFNDARLPAAAPALAEAGHPWYRLAVPPKCFATAGGLFLGWQRLVAAYGLLDGITYAGQPAVEAYKKYARDLRLAEGPVTWPEDTAFQAGFRGWTLYFDSPVKKGLLGEDAVRSEDDAAGAYAAILREAFGQFAAQGRVPYLDFTFNGELPPDILGVLRDAREELAATALKVRCKIRSGPADYHSTEQSETDGPPEVISLRIVALTHEAPVAGEYSDKFLLAQARGTWQAMEDAGRWILMMTAPRLDEAALGELRSFFRKTIQQFS